MPLHYQTHLEEKKPPHKFEFHDPMWHSWNDYDFGVIFGVKIKDNLGFSQRDVI